MLCEIHFFRCENGGIPMIFLFLVDIFLVNNYIR